MSRVECMCWCIHTGDVYACSSAELCVAAWVPCSNITTYNLCAFISKNRKMHTKINTTKCAHTHIHLAMYTCAQTSMWDPLRIPFRTKKKWEFYICTFWYCFYIYCIERLGDAFYFYTFSVCTIRETHIDICTHRIWTFMLLFLFLFLSSSLFFGSQFNVSTPNTVYTMKKC